MKILVAAVYDIPDKAADTVDPNVVIERVTQKLTIPDGDVEQVTVSIYDPPAPLGTAETELTPGASQPAPSGRTIDDPTDDAGGNPGQYGNGGRR